MKIDPYKILIGNGTDIGKIRSINEDYMAHFSTPYGYCIIICDGMGGHAAGDIASQGAIEAIKHYLQDGKVTKLDTVNALQNVIEFANYKLREMVQQNPALTGMGTTCVMALINNAEMYVAHAGDSRLYLIRENNIKQLTRDHSTIQNLIDAGVLTEEESLHSDKRNQITKAIGIFDKVEPTITKEAIRLKHNDKILLCSDGLTAYVNQNEILKTTKAHPDVQDAAMKLIEKANSGGGSDNITIQLIQYYGKSSVVKKNRRIRKSILFIIIFLIVIAIGYITYWRLGSSNKDNTKTDESISTSDKDSNVGNEDSN